MTASIRVAAVQLRSGPDKAANLEAAIRLSSLAADEGATYVQLPEYFSYLGPQRRYSSMAEAIPGPTTDRMAALAVSRGVALHLGSMLESSRVPGKSFNTSVLIDSTGALVATYRKAHLFDVDVPGGVVHRESDAVAPGDALVVVGVGPMTLGLSVCFDLRFSELYRSLALRGATVLAVPSAFAAATGRVHWEVLLRARAIENLAFVVAAAQAGTTIDGIATWGHSMIVDPWGQIVAQSGVDGEDVVVVSLDLDDVARRRAQIDVLGLRRPDLYGAVANPRGSVGGDGAT